MDRTIMTCGTLKRLVELDTKTHKVKDLAELFLVAMRDWRTFNQILISDFVAELQNYFGSPLTLETIRIKQFDGQNAWEVEAGSSIAEMIETSTQFFFESKFENILQNILSYYGEELSKVDFIAELKYRTAAESGRKNSGTFWLQTAGKI